MVARAELERFLNEYLDVDQYQDYCPNGLQIEGSDNIQTIVTGVTASKALIDKAVELGADAILVHHGYFWKGEFEPIVGLKKKRIASLISNDINLFAYHLPLDMHPVIGNNVQLALELGLDTINVGDSIPGFPGVVCELAEIQSVSHVKNLLSENLGFDALHVGGSGKIKRIAICTGAAQDYIELLINKGIDAYISGEISERTVHSAVEGGIHYFSAGHHATERGGVRALGELLNKEFDLRVVFVDLPVPV